MSEYLDGIDDDFESGIQAFRNNLNTVRAGRASPQLIEGVQVDVTAYGAKMGLKEIASINAPDARLLVVNPWDKTTINDIERAIRSAGLGLNPNNDGQVVRVPIPPLTGERRADLVRRVRQLAEEARIRARKVRRDYNDLIKELENEKEISEDESRTLGKSIQTKTDKCISLVDKIAAEKEEEVMAV